MKEIPLYWDGKYFYPAIEDQAIFKHICLGADKITKAAYIEFQQVAMLHRYHFTKKDYDRQTQA